MWKLLSLVLGLVLAVGCAANRESEDHEVAVPVNDVPAVAKGAVEKEIPGITITRAEREVENGVVVYDLEGKTKDGTEYEIEVTAAGKIIEVEKEGDGHDDDDEDDDEDEEDDD